MNGGKTLDKRTWLVNLGLALLIALAASDTWSAAGQPAQVSEAELQQQWRAWHQRSETLRRADQQAMARELETSGKARPAIAERANDSGLDLSKPADFYKTEAGRQIADIVLSYQTPSGGWSKRVDMSVRPRYKGEAYGTEKGYQPTFDNYATSTQLHLLAKAYAATGDARYRDGFARGLALILDAQMPNGGWPQSYPLDGGYHDLITYNDKSAVNLLELLQAVVDAGPGYGLVSAEQRAGAARALLRGIDCLLRTQVQVNGHFSIWGAQHDSFSLKPAPARAYEPAALASQESAEILLFLMDLPNPPQVVVQAVEDAMAWFRTHQIDGQRWDKAQGQLVSDPDAKPLWPRFYDPQTDSPVFGDRDGEVYTDIGKVSLERRQGYGWYSTAPAKLEKRYREWRTALGGAG